jgi:hypothetical protein
VNALSFLKTRVNALSFLKTRVNALYLGWPPGRRDALQATRAGFDSQSVHQFIPVNRPWWMGLTVNQDAAGSNPATGANFANNGAIV